jgi:hypothetical protein
MVTHPAASSYEIPPHFFGNLNRQVPELETTVSHRKQRPVTCPNAQTAKKSKTEHAIFGTNSFRCRCSAGAFFCPAAFLSFALPRQSSDADRMKTDTFQRALHPCRIRPRRDASLGLSSRIEAPRPADIRIAALVKTKKAVSFKPDSDAHANANFSPGLPLSAQPKRAFCAQIAPIQAARNPQRRGEPSGAAREFGQKPCRFFARSRAHAFDGAMPLHPVNALERLESAKKNSFADAFALSGNVEHVVVAINKINVRMPAFAKKRAVASRESAKCVGRSIANNIRFGFDDPSAEPDMRQVVHERFADEKTRKLDSINGKLAAAEPANASFRARNRHAIRSIIRAAFARLTIFS